MKLNIMIKELTKSNIVNKNICWSNLSVKEFQDQIIKPAILIKIFKSTCLHTIDYIISHNLQPKIEKMIKYIPNENITDRLLEILVENEVTISISFLIKIINNGDFFNLTYIYNANNKLFLLLNTKIIKTISNHIQLLTLLQDVMFTKIRFIIIKHLLINSIENSDVDTIKMLCDNYKNQVNLIDINLSICNYDILNLLHNYHLLTKNIITKTLIEAAANDSLDIFKKCVNSYDCIKIDCKIIETSFKNLSFNVLDFIADNNELTFPYPSDIIEYAFENDLVQILLWFEKYPKIDFIINIDKCLSLAVMNLSFKCILYLISREYTVYITINDIMQLIAYSESDCIKLIKWLIANKVNFENTYDLINNLLIAGFTSTLDVLYENTDFEYPLNIKITNKKSIKWWNSNQNRSQITIRNK